MVATSIIPILEPNARLNFLKTIIGWIPLFM